MKLFHDSRDSLFRAPGGAQPCGEVVQLRLRVTGETPDAVHLRLWFGKESFLPMRPNADDATLYEATVTLPETPCLLWYDFQVWTKGQFFWYGNAQDSLGGEGAPIWGEARSYQITVYDRKFTAPSWTHSAVFYQIFPDRFARGSSGVHPPKGPDCFFHENWDEKPLLMYDKKTGDNVAHDFFGGTLEGIQEKLPYIASLGVTALYLNPIFHAYTNHRFDTTDWKQVDPVLGTNEDFTALCEEAAKYGIHVVLDGVFSHSGDHCPFFLHAKAVQDSPYRNWYHFEEWPDEYKSWWGFKTLPELNKYQPEVVDYFLSDEDAVVKKWLREGADGWRIDVADELPMAYLRILRGNLKHTNADAMVVGEVWEDASNKVAYGKMRSYCLGDTLDCVMNYPLREAAIEFLMGKIDAMGFKRQMDSLYENYPAPFAQSLMNVLGSHDRARALNVLSGEDGCDLPRATQAELALTEEQHQLGRNRLKLMLQLVVAMPGIPCVYYGDEAGMEGCADPFNRGTFPWGREDAALTDYFRTVLTRRREMPILTDGALTIDVLSPDVLCVCRSNADARFYTLVNRSDQSQTVMVDGREITLAAYGHENIEA